MSDKLLKILNQLKSPATSEEVDHILLLHDLYWKYSEGAKFLQPIITYYLNSIDDVPTLKERNNWNKEKFEEIRRPLIESHQELINAVNEVLKNIK